MCKLDILQAYDFRPDVGSCPPSTGGGLNGGGSEDISSSASGGSAGHIAQEVHQSLPSTSHHPLHGAGDSADTGDIEKPAEETLLPRVTVISANEMAATQASVSKNVYLNVSVIRAQMPPHFILIVCSPGWAH